MKPAATFSELLQGFFTDRLMRQCNASALTIANYRDAFCLLIAYAQRCLKKPAYQTHHSGFGCSIHCPLP